MATFPLFRKALLFIALCALFIASTLFTAPLMAQSERERITSFHSHITVHPDSSMTVQETIDVVVKGIQIKRGIYRDFPTTYKTDKGNRLTVGFDVLEVTRNGLAEPYSIEGLSNGKRVRIGSANIFLDPGTYRYTITYRTTRQLGYFTDFDELYWNVTGNGWDFTIEKASAQVNLPNQARPLNWAAYTGFSGAQGQDYQVTDSLTGFAVKTTRPLSSREGLTIAVSWPKGHVTEPSTSEEVGFFLSDNRSSAILIAGLLVVLGYFYAMWNKYGRDPLAGTIIPLFEPPEGFSPAACRFIWKMGYDNKAVTAALVNMAVKGALTIEESGRGSFALTQHEDFDEKKLSSGERKILHGFFSPWRNTLKLKQSNHSTIRKGLANFQDYLENEFELAYFKKNAKLFYIGLGLSIFFSLLAALFAPGGFVAIFLSLWLSFWTIGCVTLVKRAYDAWQSALRLGGLNYIGALFISAFASPFLIAEFAVLGIFGSTTGFSFMLLVIVLGALNAVFFFLLKAPTRLGRQIMDEIEGFRRYLSVAEQNRLDQLTPPEKTPELFEKYLPYAIALDVDTEWGEQFSEVLASATTTDGKGGHYRPSWYHGRSWDRIGASGFGTALGSSLSNTVSSSSRAPGSSSGSSGGGSSGGGGGGGGGGGW